MNAVQVVEQLKSLGAESYKRVLMNHGAREPAFGVKIEELKKIAKVHRHDHQLGLDLYDTGIYDAQYLAGLIIDGKSMKKKDLQRWVSKANCMAVCGSTVAWVAGESRFGWELSLEWIDSKKESTAQTGWTTLSSLVSITPDENLDLPELKGLLQRIERSIHDQPNYVRYAMNGFVIAVGSYVAPLTECALQVGTKVGPVSVDMGNTACQVPNAPDYIRKVQLRGSIGKKRKTAKC